MKKSRAGTGRAFALSLAVTLMVAAAVSGILIALGRMENTMNTQKYTLFSLQKEPGDKLSLTALDREYDIDLSGMRSAQKKWRRTGNAAPAGWRALLLAVDQLVGWLSGLIGQYI